MYVKQSTSTGISFVSSYSSWLKSCLQSPIHSAGVYATKLSSFVDWFGPFRNSNVTSAQT